MTWWWEGNRMERITKGIAIAMLYAVLSWSARQISLDQFYLPAGIRVAALLLLPRSLWVYLLIGEYAYFAYMRIPMIEKYGLTWVVLGSITLMPSVAMIVHWHRKRMRAGGEAWALSACAISAITVTALNVSLANALWPVPTPDAPLTQILQFVVGDYVGMLTIVPLVLLWKFRREAQHRSRPVHALVHHNDRHNAPAWSGIAGNPEDAGSADLTPPDINGASRYCTDLHAWMERCRDCRTHTQPLDGRDFPTMDIRPICFRHAADSGGRRNRDALHGIQHHLLLSPASGRITQRTTDHRTRQNRTRISRDGAEEAGNQHEEGRRWNRSFTQRDSALAEREGSPWARRGSNENSGCKLPRIPGGDKHGVSHGA